MELSDARICKLLVALTKRGGGVTLEANDLDSHGLTGVGPLTVYTAIRENLVKLSEHRMSITAAGRRHLDRFVRLFGGRPPNAPNAGRCLR